MKNKDWVWFIKRQMDKQKIGVSELARRSGVKQTTVSKILTREAATTSVKNVEKLLDGLGMELCVRRKVVKRR